MREEVGKNESRGKEMRWVGGFGQGVMGTFVTLLKNAMGCLCNAAAWAGARRVSHVCFIKRKHESVYQSFLTSKRK